jgi:hypothetical protein
MTARPALLALAAGIAIACSKSPEDKAKQSAGTIRSWNATVAAVDSARGKRQVPEHFVRDVHRVAAEEVARAAAQSK